MLRFHALAERGEPVSGRYFERFWLPIVGPTSVVLMRHLALELEREDLLAIAEVELARRLGVKQVVLERTVGRLQGFGLLVPVTVREWRVRLNVRPLEERQVARLPRVLAEQHREMTRMLELI